jgi:hypothetical protein
LVLDDGIRLPVHLGNHSAAWFALDVDLQGLGRLDYSNVCPWGIVDRSIVVFHGPASAAAYLSISGTPLEATVPARGSRKPLVVEHRGLTIVICNTQQIDATYHGEKAVYLGIDGFDADGVPRPHPQWVEALVIRRDGKVERLAAAGAAGAGKGTATKPAKSRTSSARIVKPAAWQVSASRAHIEGTSPRFASLEGPQSLSECGAPSGYGWYRVPLKKPGRGMMHLPMSADRMHLYIDGKLRRVFGSGPGADARPFRLPAMRGDSSMVVLADNLGRYSDGNEIAQGKGLWGHVYEVRPLRTPKPKIQEHEPVDPFALRGFLTGRVKGQLSDSRQAVWTFSHTRKTAILIDVNGANAAGTWTLNDEPIGYSSGATAGCLDRIIIDRDITEPFKRGRNVLRFAPEVRQDKAVEEIIKHTTLYECAQALSEVSASAAWAFAKWEPPPVSSYDEADGAAMRSAKGVPTWWRASCVLEADESAGRMPLWLEVAGMTKGQAYINGRNLGRYFTATAAGKSVGPQTRLYIPEPWIKAGANNELILFDEHGASPARARLIRAQE